LSLKIKVDGLAVVWHQNHWDSFSSVWTSKLMATICERFCLKTTRTVFSNLASKLVVGFLVERQNQDGGGFFGLGLKTGGGFLGWASKPRWWRIFWFGPQNRQLQFGDLGLKITVMVSWFGPQNQAGFSLSVAPQNRRREVGMGHASRSSGLLHVEASLARVS
jgi:hypothetical protein